MRGAVSGTHGLIGAALVRRLEDRGDSIVRLVRSRTEDPGAVSWDPQSGRMDAGRLEGLDYVIHLAGANIGARPWTPAQRRRIRRSRVEGTALIARTLATLRERPPVMLSASAVGFYGDRGDEELTERSSPGRGFRADVCREWEAATRPTEDSGIRVVHLRSGIVLSKKGGLLPYVGGAHRLPFVPRLGSGEQWWSWIAIDDEIEAILHLLESPSIGGAVNLTAPNPVRQREFARELANASGRRVVGIPRIVLELALGPQRAREVLLSSERAVPVRLIESGFSFRHEDVASALGSIVRTSR